MLKRKPVIEYYQMLPHFEGEYEAKQNNIDFESLKEKFMEADKKMLLERRIERRNKAADSLSYTKYEDIPQNKEKFVCGFKHIRTDKVDNFRLIGCESDELYENDN